jgi:hypothetical protein
MKNTSELRVFDVGLNIEGMAKGCDGNSSALDLTVKFPADAADCEDMRGKPALICTICSIGGEPQLDN